MPHGVLAEFVRQCVRGAPCGDVRELTLGGFHPLDSGASGFRLHAH